MTENQQIRHFAYSDLFRQKKDCFLEQGRRIEINLGDNNSSTEMRTVPLSPWCETGSERKIQEQSRPLSGNRILTLLWLPAGSLKSPLCSRPCTLSTNRYAAGVNIWRSESDRRQFLIDDLPGEIVLRRIDKSIGLNLKRDTTTGLEIDL